MWHFRIWFCRNYGVGWMVGLDDIRGLFQPKTLWFCDSMTMLCLVQPRILLTFFMAKAHCWSMLTWWPSEHFLSSCFPAGLPPAYIGAWGHSSPGAGLCTSPCWISWGSCQPASPACQGPPVWQHDLLMCQPLHPVLCHLQSWWGYTDQCR